MPGDKLPALNYGWQTRATDDAAQLAEWDRGMADLNWAVNCGASGLFVFDVDPKGMQAWEDIKARSPEMRAAIEKAFTVRTPRGGLHVYFRGWGPTTASRIADGIDTRGGYWDEHTGRMKSLGYVVAPGSKTVANAERKTVDGEYTALGGVVEPMPPAVLAIVPEKKKGEVLGLDFDIEKDNPRNVKTCVDLLTGYVQSGRVSVEGSGGDNTCYQVVASILDKGISPGKAMELLDEHWNGHCVPPWEEWELETKILNALKYGEETESGAKGFETNQSAFEKWATYQAPEEPKHEERRREKVQWIDDYAGRVRDPVWLVPGIIPAHGTGMLYGPSGSYKSFLALDLACCLAHGHPGQWSAPAVAHDVLYFAGEAPIGTAKQRRPAWLEWQNITTPHRLAIFPRVPFMGDGDGWEGIKLDLAEMGMKPSLIVIDTMTRLLTGFDENSTKDASKATGFLEELARFYECFVLVVHHTGKDESRGARGSSAFFANMDTVLSTKKKPGGMEFRIKKHKDADAPDTGQYFLTRQIGRSLVLERTDAPVPEEVKKGSKISWSSPEEVAKVIAENGGNVSHAVMSQTIAGNHGLDKSRVGKELKSRADIQFMRDGDQWRIAGMDAKPEFDL